MEEAKLSYGEEAGGVLLVVGARCERGGAVNKKGGKSPKLGERES
jgi:hypothetical protein